VDEKIFPEIINMNASFYAIIKSYFKKHWKTIALQIEVVNDIFNPKHAFLFDCCAVDVDKLNGMIEKLKSDEFISKEIKIVALKEDFFILNTKKFQHKTNHVIIDASGRLKKPEIKESLEVQEMLDDIRSQIIAKQDELMINLDMKETWSGPTIFGYLINYPILYFVDDDENCLSLIDLKVHQIKIKDEILISFSVPSEIHDNNLIVKQAISSWLSFFHKSDHFKIEIFDANHSSVIL
jgi:hypothetical protein